MKHYIENQLIYLKNTILVPNDFVWFLGGLNSNFTVSITKGYGIYITHMLIRTGNGNIPISWKVNALTYNQSLKIDSHYQGYSINKTYTKYLFKVKQGYYQELTFILTGENLGGTHTFCLSFIVFYGILTDSIGNQIVIAPYQKVKRITCNSKNDSINRKYCVIINIISFH